MNLLIIDDSHLLQSRLSRSIGLADPEIVITHAFNCQETLAILPFCHPDKVILDISLPDGSGIDLLKIIKKKEPDTTVIIFTNYPTDEFRKSCLELGADEFIDKKNLNQIINILK